MKITKNNEVKLARNDIRIGNFVASLGEKSIRITDIGLAVRAAVSRDTFGGALLAMAFEDEKRREVLNLEASTLYYFLSTAKDQECYRDIVEALNRNVARHPDIYGKGEGTDGEHEAAAREVRELRDFEDELKNLPEDGDSQEG